MPIPRSLFQVRGLYVSIPGLGKDELVEFDNSAVQCDRLFAFLRAYDFGRHDPSQASKQASNLQRQQPPSPSTPGTVWMVEDYRIVVESYEG